MKEIREVFIQRYDYEVNMQSLDNAADVLQGKFVSKDDEYKRFCRIDILEEDSNNIFHRMNNFTTRLENEEFKKQIDDIIEVGLKRYHDKYQSSLKNESPFVLYEKYSRDRTSYQIMIACKMAKQTIKCENSYIIQKSIYAGWKDYMQGLESKKYWC